MWDIRLRLTDLPIEIDGELYRLKIVPLLGGDKRVINRYSLELEEIENEQATK